MAKLLQDPTGKPSSKRTNGTLLIWTGVLMALVAFVFSLFKPIPNPTFTERLILGIIFAGCLLDGSTIGEKLVKKFTGK